MPSIQPLIHISIDEITPANIKDIMSRNTSIKYDLEGKFKEYKTDYTDFLLGSTNVEIKGFQNLHYHIEFWDALLSEDTKKFDKTNEAEQLLKLNFDELAQADSLGFDDDEKEQFKYNKLFYLHRVNDELQKYKIACESRIKMIGMRPIDSKWVFFDCYYSIIYQNDKSCTDCSHQLDLSISQYFDNNKLEFIQKTEVRDDFQTEFLLWDFYEKYSKNNKLKIHIQSVNTQLKEFCKAKDKTIFSNKYNLQDWYYELTKQYLGNNFAPAYTFGQLENQFNSMPSVAKLPVIPRDEQTDQGSAKAEYLTYYCLWQLKYNETQCNKENIRQILNEAVRICSNPSSKAYNYLEKTVARVLLESITDTEPTIDLELMKRNLDKQAPEIALHPDMLKFEIGGRRIVNGSGSIDVKYDIRDFSKIKTLQLFLNEKEIKIFESEKTKENITTTLATLITVNVGRNIVKIVAIDEFGNSSMKVFEIEASDIPIKRAKFYALMIGINRYQNSTWNLATCIKDCKDISTILKNKYGFVVDTLFNEQATGEGIIRKLIELKKKTDLDSNTNVLVYYSGHGEEADEVAYWVPSDTKDESNWISTSVVKDHISAISKKVRHTLLMVDACYSGVIFNQFKSPDEIVIGNEEKYYEAKSVHGLTSGGNKRVPAQSGTCGSGNSSFTCALTQILNNNNESYLMTSSIAAQISTKLSNDSEARKEKQTSHYSTLGTGGVLGEFIFINQKSLTSQRQVTKSKSSTNATFKSTQVNGQSQLPTIAKKAIIIPPKSIIHWSPSTDAITTSYFIKGDEVNILEANEAWLRVRYYNVQKKKNISGWILKSDVK